MIRTVLLENILKHLGKLARSLEDTYHRHPSQPKSKSLEHNQSDEKLILPSALSGSSQYDWLLREEGKGKHQLPCSLLYSSSSAICVSEVLEPAAVFLCQLDLDGFIFHEIIYWSFELT